MGTVKGGDTLNIHFGCLVQVSSPTQPRGAVSQALPLLIRGGSRYPLELYFSWSQGAFDVIGDLEPCPTVTSLSLRGLNGNRLGGGPGSKPS